MRTRLIILCIVGLVMPGILLDLRLCAASEATSRPSGKSTTKPSTSITPTSRPASKPSTNPASEPAESPYWKVIKLYGYVIAVPKSWPQQAIPGTANLTFVGDGIAAPAKDEKGGPIQVGLSIEPGALATTDSPAVIAKQDQQKAAKQAPQTILYTNQAQSKVLSSELVPKLKLSDGAEAAFTRTLMLSLGHRRNLQLKLFAKDKKSRCIVVTAWITTSVQSGFPNKSKDLERLLKAHLTSLCFDLDKLDTTALEKIYESKATSRPAGASTAKPVKP
jgi:hypothetical protein